VSCWLDTEAPYVPFFTDGGRGEQIAGGLGVDDLNDVLPPCIFAAVAT
jgi:hypothetical protein